MVDKSKYRLLFNINSPKDIRSFDVHELKELATEVRQYMVDVISETGGHFGGGLGATDLTVALHKVFNTPQDKIIWDTGHQAYPHKILTGRRDSLHTIRQFKGISGFLKRNESEYDAFGAGHASTSISAAVGIAEANKLKNSSDKVVAVIGDGAMTGGMAYEALNNAGIYKSNVIVVLNDNHMSISKNVWQLSNYFTEVITHPDYNKVKGVIWEFTGKLETFGDRLRKAGARLESGIKSVITPGMMFEALGFRYFGPINGHNMQKLINVFELVKKLNGPILVHILTEKGKGYKPAEGHVQRLHASSPFDKITGEALAKSEKLSYTSVFGKALVEIVEKDKSVVGITAAMPDGTGLDQLQAAFPSNFFDVGIAEEHGVTFAAGLATEGIIPVVAIYSTFLQRAIDQVMHDVALQDLHCVFVLDRAGLVGADGPTHHGTLDLTYLRMIPGVTVMAPKDESELRDMLYTAVYKIKGPVAIRYPRGNALGVELKPGFDEIPAGKAEILREGKDAAILAVGSMTDTAMKAAALLAGQNIECRVVNMRFIKPLDTDLLDETAASYKRIITVEENTLTGGFGSAVAEYYSDKQLKPALYRLGLPDDYVEHGTQTELYNMLGLNPAGIAGFIKNLFAD